MQVDQILQASEVIASLSALSADLPEDRDQAVRMSAHLKITRLYLLEYAKHLLDGHEPYEALLMTARGELKLSEQQQDLMRALNPLSAARDGES